MSEDILPASKVHPNQKIFYKNITFEIIEVNQVKGYKNRVTYVISYRLIDGGFTSPVAHLFVSPTDDVRKHVKQVIDHYLHNKEYIRRVLSR